MSQLVRIRFTLNGRPQSVKVPPMTIAVLRRPGEDLAFNRFDHALLGGRAETFMGLAGAGDLILTCTNTMIFR